MPDRTPPEYKPSVTPAAEPNQARQSVKLGTMRYVLAGSILLVIIAFAVAYWLTPA